LRVPELPDLTVYQEHLEARIAASGWNRSASASAFLLRTVTPGVDEVAGRTVTACSRLAKQLVIELDGELLRRGAPDDRRPPAVAPRNAAVPRRNGLAAFDFSSGTLLLTEARHKRAHPCV
jgi:formamidopyrimidine-DNA glycosylase